MNRIKKVVSVWVLTACVLPLAAQYPVIPDSVRTTTTPWRNVTAYYNE